MTKCMAGTYGGRSPRVLRGGIRYSWKLHDVGPAFLLQPFYNPATFSATKVFHGTSIAVLTYIGFDGISTLSEEVENPRRNILLATVLVCVITGVLSSLESMRHNWCGELTLPGRQGGICISDRGNASGRTDAVRAAESHDPGGEHRFR